MAAAPSVGDRLINHPAMEAISITGSPATGMAAMRAASQQIRHVHLELGGKAPVIVFDDADLEAVVDRPARGVRAGGVGHPVHRCGGGGRLGQ
jgi:aminobutyraldehyde dehydrogenase